LKDMDPARIPHAVRESSRAIIAMPRALVGLLLDELAA